VWKENRQLLCIAYIRVYLTLTRMRRTTKKHDVKSLSRGKGSDTPYHLRTSIPMSNRRANAREGFYTLN
jgi:hypothetical protein